MRIFIPYYSGLTCNEDEEQSDYVKVVISASGQPVIMTPFNQKLMIGER